MQERPETVAARDTRGEAGNAEKKWINRDENSA